MPICQRAPGTRSSCEIKKMDCTVQVDNVLTSLFMCEPLTPGILESFFPINLEKILKWQHLVCRRKISNLLEQPWLKDVF